MTAVLLFTSLVTAMTTFASSNAGASLQQWYNLQFQEATRDIDTHVATPALHQAEQDLQAAAEQRIEQLQTQIQSYGDDVAEEAVETILDHNGQYIEEIRNKQDELKNGAIARDFDQFAAQTDEQVTQSIQQETTRFLQEWMKNNGAAANN
jgi:hypothetical protein